MTDRRVIVEAAFGISWAAVPAAGDWVPLIRPDTGKTRAKQASWTVGRDNELEHYPPGTATLVLWDRDRALDPDNASSPYAGDLQPLTPVRIRSQDVDTLTISDEFYGFALGWDPVLSPKGSSDRSVKLIDLLGVIGGFTLPGVFDHALTSLGPVGLYKLDGPTDGGEVADLSGNGNHGDVVGTVEFGQPPVAPGHGTSALFRVVDTQFGEIDLGRSPIVADTRFVSVVATVRTRDVTDVINFRTVFTQGDGSNHHFTLAVDDDGSPLWTYDPPVFSGFTFKPPTTITDGEGHLLIGQSNVGNLDLFGLAVDSADLYQVNTGGLIIGTNGAGIGGHRGIQTPDFYDGWIGTIAVYDYPLDDTERQSVVDGYGMLDGLRSDEQISWALDRVGIDAGLRDLDEGTVIMGPADTAGREAVEWIRDVVATEQGDLYVDHRNGGVLRFRNRYWRHLETGSTTVQVSFTDDPDGVGVKYSDDGLDIAAAGRDEIINQVTVSWVGGEITKSIDSSVTAWGPRPRTVETIATTAAQAESVAEWLLARYQAPRTRVRGARPAAITTHSRDDDIHALEVGDRVTFRVQPLHTGDPTEFDLWVEGIDHNVRGVEWVTSFRFSPVDTFTPWIWGTSEWDVDAVWG